MKVVRTIDHDIELTFSECVFDYWENRKKNDNMKDNYFCNSTTGAYNLITCTLDNDYKEHCFCEDIDGEILYGTSIQPPALNGEEWNICLAK